MSYQVIARKFRPQSFADFVGQTHVTQTLRNALASERFPHALLLNGPRGTGKTTTARIIAKTLLCENPQDFNPCGQCPSCESVKAGSHLDVIEIDGASNNGVDHIRELREGIGYMPSQGAYKIYIIDEVHMLSTSAFNALLKTLEEPPEHVIFIFATTEVQKIPATILSRCQRYDFRNHSLTDIKSHLQNICGQVQVTADEEALWTIAKQARGSIRDGLTLLDQLISHGQGTLTQEQVMSLLGLNDRRLLMNLLKALGEQSEKGVFSVTRSLEESGADPHLFCEQFLESLRNALLVKWECHKQKSLPLSEGEIEDLVQATENLTPEDLHLIFDVTLSGLQRLNHTSEPSLALEMLLFKLLHLPRLTQGLSEGVTPAQRSVPLRSEKTKTLSAPAKAQKAPNSQATEAPTTPATTLSPPPPAEAKAKEPPMVPLEPVGRTWPEFVNAVKQSNGFLGALLEHTFILQDEDKTLTLGLPDKMSFLLDKLQEEKNIQRTQNFLKNYWKDERAVVIDLVKGQQAKTKLSPKAMEEKARAQRAQKEAQSIENHPLVKATERVFKDRIRQAAVVSTKPTSQKQQETPL